MPRRIKDAWSPRSKVCQPGAPLRFDGGSIRRVAARVHPRLCGFYVAAPADVPRYFLCARCRLQVLVCRSCDRGQIYCSSDCSVASRKESLRRASRTYQRSRLGARNHARRQRRYRARQKKVTHHGSPPVSLLAACLAALLVVRCLRARGLVFDTKPETSASTTANDSPCCHFCGRPVTELVRFDHSSTEAPG